MDCPKKHDDAQPGIANTGTGFASSHLGGATLALSDQGTPSGGCDAASIRSASTGGVMTSSVTRGRVPTRDVTFDDVIDIEIERNDKQAGKLNKLCEISGKNR